MPATLSAQLRSPIIPGGESGSQGPTDSVLSVQEHLPAEGAPLYEISENGVVLSTENGLEEAARAVESWAQLTVATLAKELVFVHAGVVGWRGKAIVIPGRSLSGKSTLALALVKAGADYYSDEYAVVGPDGRIHPYWRFPMIRDASGYKSASRLLGERLIGSPPSPIPLGWVLISRYAPKARWRPRLLTTGETLLGLLDNAVPLRNRPEQCVKTLSVAVANAQGFGGPRGEAASFARQALKLLGPAQKP